MEKEFIQDEEVVTKEDSFGTKLGRFLGGLVVTCMTACISACMIALTLRFLMLLF